MPSFLAPPFFGLILVGDLGCANLGDPFLGQLLVARDLAGELGCANVDDPVLDQILVARCLVADLGWRMGCTNVFGPLPCFVDFGIWDDGRVGIVGNGGSIFVCALFLAPFS